MSRDLMHSAEVKDLVRQAYRDVPPTTAAVAYKLYSEAELAEVPRIAIERALGVANHLRFADIRPGDTVLDLGCGAGIDTILAARRVGTSGEVIALDFLPEMLERAGDAVRAAGLTTVRLLEGELEAIPLPEDSVDLIISNGVINLSPRKARVLAGRTTCLPRSSRSPRPGPAASRAHWPRKISSASWKGPGSWTWRWSVVNHSASTTAPCIPCSPTRSSS